MKKLLSILILGSLLTIVSSINFVDAEELEKPPVTNAENKSTDQPKPIEVIIPKGTEFQTKLVNEINPDKIKQGDIIQFKLAISYTNDERILIPQGSTFNGVVVNVINPTSNRDNIFELIININSITTLFGKELPVKAHPILNIAEPTVKKSRWHLFSIKLGDDDRDLLEKKTWDSKKPGNSAKNTTTIKPEIMPVDQQMPVVLDDDLKINFKSKF